MSLLIIRLGVTVRECSRGLHTSECTKFKIQKIKHLFIIIEVQLITISSVIPYTSETNSTSSSLKKKELNPQERKRKGKRDGKEENKRKWMERVCAKGKEKGRMRCGRK